MERKSYAIVPIGDLENLRTTIDRLQGNVSKKIERPEHGTGNGSAERLALAQYIYKVRRARADAFPDDIEIFHDPAWDMLLDLYIAQVRSVAVSITSACIGADVPGTTALRWIKTLETRGLVVRQQDINDRRRSYVALTEKAFCAMEQFLQALDV